MRPMEPARPRVVLPGPIRQNGYVVDDLGRAVDAWLEVGVGPWLLLPDLTQSGTVYRGRPTEPVVSIAFANSGDLQLELIEQRDDSPSIYREFLDTGRRGFHHLAWWAEDFDAAASAAETAGWPTVHAGDGGGMARFAYYDQGGVTSTVVELMELNDITRWLVTTVREASVEWDGSDPVRNLF